MFHLHMIQYSNLEMPMRSFKPYSKEEQNMQPIFKQKAKVLSRQKHFKTSYDLTTQKRRYLNKQYLLLKLT